MNYSIDVLPDSSEYSEEPVTVEDLYAHLSLNVTLEAVQDVLAVFITAAREQFEANTDGRIVLPRVYVQNISCWERYNALQRAKVLELGEITYLDENDEQQTLEDFQTDLTGIPALFWKDTYPAISQTHPRPISITFLAGWESKDVLPQNVRLAIMLLASFYYGQRESHSDIDYKIVPEGFQRVTDNYKTGLKRI